MYKHGKEAITDFIDKQLNDFLMKMFNYIQDTQNFIK